MGNNKNPRIHFLCDNCGAESSDKPSSYNKKKRHFCNQSCYSIFRRDKLPLEEQHKYSGVRKPGESKQVYHRNYVAKNRENIRHLQSRYYSRKKGAEGSHTLQEWNDLKKEFGNKCACCWTTGQMTKDHIIPLSKGGSNYIANIQPLCRNCNSRKHVELTRYENPELLTK